MKKLLILIASCIVIFSSCKKEDMTNTTNDTITTPVSDTLSKGTFIGVDHSLSGKAILFKDISENHILRLEEFNMTSAPDADVFLSKTQNYVAANVIKVYDLGSGNYSNNAINIDVDENIVYSDYPYVIVWCTQFSAYFGHAPLQ